MPNKYDLIFAPVLFKDGHITRRRMALGIYMGSGRSEPAGETPFDGRMILDLEDQHLRYIHAGKRDKNNYGKPGEQEDCIKVVDLNTSAISNFNSLSNMKLGYMIDPMSGKMISQPDSDATIKIPDERFAYPAAATRTHVQRETEMPRTPTTTEMQRNLDEIRRVQAEIAQLKAGVGLRAPVEAGSRSGPSKSIPKDGLGGTDTSGVTNPVIDDLSYPEAGDVSSRVGVYEDGRGGGGLRKRKKSKRKKKKSTRR